MRKHAKMLTCFLFVVWAVNIKVNDVFGYSSGPPFRRTGSPADDFKTCKDVNCHNTYSLNSGKAAFSVSMPDRYIPGEVFNITISFKNSAGRRHGFELSALNAKNNHAGTFRSVDGNTQTSSDGNYVEHTSKGCDQTGGAHWNIKWIAPASEVQDPVTFYAAGNEAYGTHTHRNQYKHDGDHGHDGDYIYTATVQVNRGAATPTPSVTPTPSAECETESISVSPNAFMIKTGNNDEVMVTLVATEGCSPEEGKVITVKVNKASKKRISISPRSAATDADGAAKFIITAKRKVGKARVTFLYRNFKKSITVEVMK